MAALAAQTQLRAELAANCIRIFRDGQESAVVTQHAAENSRPYIHPLLAPDGNGVLTQDRPPHHPWQHGLYIGLNAVNGAGFWSEGLGKNPHDGTFHPRPMRPPVIAGNTARWAVETDWRAPGGAALIADVQAWRFTDLGATYTLDLDWTIRAETNLTFGKYAYGGLFLRMPYSPERGGSAVNSDGLNNAQAEGRRARWVAVSMAVDGRSTPAGIALMDHPGNPEFPSPWRVDGQLGIAPSRCIAGEWKLAAGESCRLRHRALVFCGGVDKNTIEANWKVFSATLSQE